MQTSVSKKHTPLIVRVILGLLLAPIVFVAGLMLILIVWMRTMHIQWLRENMIRFNKQTLNPTTLKIARPLGDGFVIPLPYGAGVDWCRNVLAARTCSLIWNEQEYTLERPEIIQPSQALKAFPVGSRLLYPAGGIKQYLWLHQRKEVPETVPADAVPQPISVVGV